MSSEFEGKRLANMLHGCKWLGRMKYIGKRDTVRSEIAWLEQQLLDTSLQSREKEKIRAEIAALASTLDMFDGIDSLFIREVLLND